MKKSKGFTLIELLAVIVILAIIALIATPMVLKYIESSKEKSFKISIGSIERAAELKILDMKQEGKVKYPVEIDVQDLDIKNNKGLIGTVTISKDINGNNVYTYDLTNGEYNLIGSREDEVYKVDKSAKIVFKTENGVIDKNTNYIYSFYDEGEERNGYFLDETIISDYIGVENGTLEFEYADYTVLSTGSKIVLKDKDGKVAQKYTIIIFGDINEDGLLDASDSSGLEAYLYNLEPLTNYQKRAGDVNNDGKVDANDVTIIENHDLWLCQYNQITHECTEYS